MRSGCGTGLPFAPIVPAKARPCMTRHANLGRPWLTPERHGPRREREATMLGTGYTVWGSVASR